MFDAAEQTETSQTMRDKGEIDRFSTPHRAEESEFDRKALAGAKRFEIPFEARLLKAYTWGAGRPILLIHGWGSRASHMAMLGRILAKRGFKAVAIDGPAHGESVSPDCTTTSSLPEFCRAIYHMANQIGPFHGLAGHSFGAIACAFAAAGHANVVGYKVDVEKLCLISPPPHVQQMIQHYCHKCGYSPKTADRLEALLENTYPFRVKDYTLSAALGAITSDILIIHDRDDKDVAFAYTLGVITNHPHVHFVQTHGEGHNKILLSRALLKSVSHFF